MIIKSATILCLIALSHAANIKRRDIPVEVRFEQTGQDAISNDILKGSGVGQLKSAPLKLEENAPPLNKIQEKPKEEPLKVIEKNPDEVKLQGEPQKLLQYPKLDERLPDLKLQETPSLDKKQVQEAPVLVVKKEEKPIAPLEKVPETQGHVLKGIQTDVKLTEPDGVTRLKKQIEPAKSLDVQSILNEAHEIALSGLKNLRASVAEKGPNSEQWESLERKVNNYFEGERKKLDLKQDTQTQPPQNQNFIQTIATNFQSLTSGFLQNFQGTSTVATISEEGGQATSSPAQGGGGGPLQGITDMIQSGFTNIQQSIQNLAGGGGPSTSNTVLGETTTSAPNVIQNLVTGFQNIVSNIGSAVQPSTVANPVDASGTTNPQGPGQIFQQIGNTISGFISGNQPSTVVSVENSGSTQAPNIIQSISQNFNNAIQSINPFNRPDPAPSAGSQPVVEAADSKIPEQTTQPAKPAQPELVKEELIKPEVTKPEPPKSDPPKVDIIFPPQQPIKIDDRLRPENLVILSKPSSEKPQLPDPLSLPTPPQPSPVVKPASTEKKD